MTARKFSLFAVILTAVLFTCESVPEFCGKGIEYNPDCDFCRGSKAYRMCANEKGAYNPLIQGCVEGTEVIGTRCADDRVVPKNTPCGGYTLTTAVTPEGKGNFSPQPENTNFNAGDPLFLNAEPADTNYVFAGWGGTVASQENGWTYNMAGPNPQVLIVAMFKPKAAGKLETDVFPKGAGTITRVPDKETYGNGEQVTVTATAVEDSGFVFDGWSGADGSKTNPITVTMNESKTLVAIFTPAIHSLKASVKPANSGAVYIDNTAVSSGNEPRAVGTAVGVWARADEGFAFSHWEWDGGAVFADERNPLTTVSIEANTSITAVFVRGGDGNIDSPLPTGTASDTMGTPSAVDTAYVPFSVNVDATITVVYSNITYQMAIKANAEKALSIPLQKTGNMSVSVTVSASGYVDTAYTLQVQVKGINPTQIITLRATSSGGGKDFAVNNCTSAATCGSKQMPDGKTWMTENLNIPTENGSFCYDGEKSNCDKYGRLYQWAAAMSACPSGWHLPSRAEWDDLAPAVVWDTAGRALKAANGWKDNGYGTDTYGFSALPGGYRYGSNSFFNAGSHGYWWTATEGSDGYGGFAYFRNMYYDSDHVEESEGERMANSFSVRCVMGNAEPKYAVTVASAGTGSSGNGSYEAGTTVNINAGMPPSGYQFNNWTSNSNVVFADANSAATSFIMPVGAVTVTATFQNSTPICTECVGAATAGPPSGAWKLSDFEAGGTAFQDVAQNSIGQYWYYYSDGEIGGNSNPTDGIKEDEYSPTGWSLDIEGNRKGYNGSNGAWISYQLGNVFERNGNSRSAFVGLGTKVLFHCETSSGIALYNAGDAADAGIYFRYKTSFSSNDYLSFEAYDLDAHMGPDDLLYGHDGYFYYVQLPGTGGEWKSAAISFSRLRLPAWSSGRKSFDVGVIAGFQFRVEGVASGGDFAIDDVYIKGEASEIGECNR